MSKLAVVHTDTEDEDYILWAKECDACGAGRGGPSHRVELHAMTDGETVSAFCNECRRFLLCLPQSAVEARKRLDILKAADVLPAYPQAIYWLTHYERMSHEDAVAYAAERGVRKKE